MSVDTVRRSKSASTSSLITRPLFFLSPLLSLIIFTVHAQHNDLLPMIKKEKTANGGRKKSEEFFRHRLFFIIMNFYFFAKYPRNYFRQVKQQQRIEVERGCRVQHIMQYLANDYPLQHPNIVSSPLMASFSPEWTSITIACKIWARKFCRIIIILSLFWLISLVLFFFRQCRSFPTTAWNNKKKLNQVEWKKKFR